MPAKSKSQQRLFGMVYAYQTGKLKTKSKKIKDIAHSISKEDARHFAETKHKDLEKQSATKTKVMITFSKGKSFVFPSIKSALVYLSALPGITATEARTALRNRATGIKNIKLSYSN